MYPCDRCEFKAHTYNSLIEHGQQAHADKPLDPGNEFSGPSDKKLTNIIMWVRKHPDMNLRTGEGKVLLDEIDRLAAELLIAQNTIQQLTS